MKVFTSEWITRKPYSHTHTHTQKHWGGYQSLEKNRSLIQKNFLIQIFLTINSETEHQITIFSIS